MTERIFWTPSSPEDEAAITLNITSGEVELKRTNCAVYTYMGNLALFNHIYFIGDGRIMPFYVFKTVGQQHSVLEGHMIRLGYPNFKDQTWVDGVDIDAYEAHVKVLDKSCIEDVLEGWANSSEE